MIGNWTMRAARSNSLRPGRGRKFAEILLLLLIAWTASVLADPEDDVDRAPRVIDSPNERIPAVTSFPLYPPLAQRDRIEGEVTVCFKIAPDGRILYPSIESSTHEIFEEPALSAISESSFEPLAPGEELSPTTTCRTYRFRLDPASADSAGSVSHRFILRSIPPLV